MPRLASRKVSVSAPARESLTSAEPASNTSFARKHNQALKMGLVAST